MLIEHGQLIAGTSRVRPGRLWQGLARLEAGRETDSS